MNFKKFISGVSALTIAASAFAGMAVTAGATATKETDYIGSSSAAETFDGYSATAVTEGKGWNTATGTLGSADGFGLTTMPATTLPAVGASVVQPTQTLITCADLSGLGDYRVYTTVEANRNSEAAIISYIADKMGDEYTEVTTGSAAAEQLNSWSGKPSNYTYSYVRNNRTSYDLRATITAITDDVAVAAVNAHDNTTRNVKSDYTLTVGDDGDAKYTLTLDQEIYPTYSASGSALDVRKRGSGAKVVKYQLGEAINSGTLYFDSDVAIETSGTMRSARIILYDSEGAEVAVFASNPSNSDTYVTLKGNSTSLAWNYTSRATKLQSMHISFSADLNAGHTQGPINATVDLIGTDKTRQALSQKTWFNNANGIAAIGFEINGASSENDDIILDNTKLYHIATLAEGDENATISGANTADGGANSDGVFTSGEYKATALTINFSPESGYSYSSVRVTPSQALQDEGYEEQIKDFNVTLNGDVLFGIVIDTVATADDFTVTAE